MNSVRVSLIFVWNNSHNLLQHTTFIVVRMAKSHYGTFQMYVCKIMATTSISVIGSLLKFTNFSGD